MNMKTYAGPLPVSPVTASSNDSLSSKAIPTAYMNILTVSESCSVAPSDKEYAVDPDPTIEGVLGTALTILWWTPIFSYILAMVYPAAIDSTRC